MPPIPVFFIWFLIAIFIFRHHMRKNSKAQDDVSNAFWNKEEASLVIRKKDLNPEDYIIPSLAEKDFRDADYYASIGLPELTRKASFLKVLVTQPMVNFAHSTNTELRMIYGTAMLTTISNYEDTYNDYTSNLFKVGERLMQAGEEDFAIQLLEEGVHVGSDNRRLFLILAACYKHRGDMDAIDRLIEKARDLGSLTKDALLRELAELKDA